MILEINKTYTTEEILEILQVKKTYFNSHSKTVKEYLNYLCDYEILKDQNDQRKKLFYIKNIKQKLKPYYPHWKKELKKQIKQNVYNRYIEDILNKNTLQSGSNIYTIIQNNDDIISLNYSENTHKQYIRLMLKYQYGNYFEPSPVPEYQIGYVSERIWCKGTDENDEYIPMSPEEINNFLNIKCTVAHSYEDTDIKDFQSMINQDLSSENYLKLLVERKGNIYKQSLKLFFKQYKYYPRLINRYVKDKNIPEDVKSRYDMFKQIKERPIEEKIRSLRKIFSNDNQNITIQENLEEDYDIEVFDNN